jgi:hypothetical protein
LTCESCHGDRPHDDYNDYDGKRRDTHALKVACQACHIPTYAEVVSTEIDRDWTAPHYSPTACSGQGGWKPEEIHAANLIPSYRWFEGRSEVYVLGESPALNADGEYALGLPLGNVHSLASKLYPMKEHRSNSARHDATGQLIPHSTNTFFRTGDFDQAVQEGMAQVGLSGSYSLVAVHTYQTINHGVDEHSILQCGDCHDDPEFMGGPPRIDLQADFGYELNGPAETVCSRCHEFEPSLGIKQTHDLHVKDQHLECSTCHTFSRPDRGLTLEEPADDRITLSLDERRSGTLISWTPSTRAVAYDMVRGSLSVLRDADGDFFFATEACTVDDSRYLSLVDDEPAAGDGLWYVMRPVFGDGPGSYDSGGHGQAGSRDLGIEASPASCP